ncbi:MAG: tetratricopeptide repeat protein, partial [Armatimonadetes bacterium]|nr:tetratricopeptide repeat protein [Armatimonadota bacterium]
MGWLWYVVTLVPVIGLVQVGDQAMADRYTYIPLIGLFMMAAWGIGEWERGRVGECGVQNAECGVRSADLPDGETRRLGVAASVVIAALMVVAWIQVGYWHDDFTLNRHGLAVTKNNHQLHLNLACALHQQKRYAEAEREYKEAIRIRPMLIQAHSNLALLYYTRGRYAEAWNEVHECERFGPIPNQ